MGIFKRELGIKCPVTRSYVMFRGNASRFHHIEMGALEESVKEPAKQLLAQKAFDFRQRSGNGDAAPPIVYPTKTIQKQSLIAKKMNSSHEFTHTSVDKRRSIGRNVELTRYGWIHASNPKPAKQCEVAAKDMRSELSEAATDYEEILHSLSSINLQHSAIQTKLFRLMTPRRLDLQMPADVTVHGDGQRSSAPCSDYIKEMQQSFGDCQCCYHEENHHYEYDSHQLPGELVNFIVLMAIFLHYAIITFIEPNYFDWFSFCCFRNCLFVISLSVQRHRCCRHSIATLWRHHLNAHFHGTNQFAPLQQN